jgi:hypothetical protein
MTKSQKGLFESADAPSGDIKALQKQWQALVKPLQAVARIKPDRPTTMDDLEKAISRLPESEVLLKSLDELRRTTEDALQGHRKARQESFRRGEAEFIRELRESKTPLREGDSSWRVGPLELQLRREQSQARTLYNREPLIDWTPAASKSDLSELLEKSTKMLDAAALPQGLLVSAASGAYEALIETSAQKNATRASRVAMQDFYREFRVALVRSELAAGRPDRKLKHADLPRWAFLYNLDLYRKLPAAEKKGHNIAFETGSQKEQASGKGLVLNGLDPTQDYKVFCYAVAAGG